MKTEYGEWTTENGSVYEGWAFEDGTPHGKGKFTDASGITFEGDFTHGEFTGLGRLVTDYNYIYVGELKNAKMHGKGVLTAPNGQVIEGFFKNNKPIGEVKVTEPDGRIFVERHEEGICVYREEAKNQNSSKAPSASNNDEHTPNATDETNNNNSAFNQQTEPAPVIPQKKRKAVTPTTERTNCPYCNKLYTIDRLNIQQQTGSKAKCKNCRRAFTLFPSLMDFMVPDLGMLTWREDKDKLKKECEDQLVPSDDDDYEFGEMVLQLSTSSFGVPLRCLLVYDNDTEGLYRITIENVDKNGVSPKSLSKIVNTVSKYYCKPAKEKNCFEWRTESTTIQLCYDLSDAFHEQSPVNITLTFKGIDKWAYRSKKLLTSIYTEDIDNVKKLLEQEVEVDFYEDKSNRTPLHDAIDSRNGILLKLILDNLTDPSVITHEDDDQQTPLSKALMLNNENLFRMLIDKLAEFEYEAEEDFKLLAMAKYGTASHVDRFISKCSDINFQDDDGNSILHFATINNCYNSVGAILNSGASVNTRNREGRPAIHFATSSYPIFQLLMENCASLEIPDNDGTTLLEVLLAAKKSVQNGDTSVTLETCIDERIFDILPDSCQYYSTDTASVAVSRRAIPATVKREVWRRDYGKCVECGSNENLE